MARKGPLEALGVELLQPPLPTIPERGGINRWRAWMSWDAALRELRRALEGVELARPRRDYDVSQFPIRYLEYIPFTENHRIE